MITPVGRELRLLAREIARLTSQAADIKQVQAVQRELESKLLAAGATAKEIAKAAGVGRYNVSRWTAMTHRGAYGALG